MIRLFEKGLFLHLSIIIALYVFKLQSLDHKTKANILLRHIIGRYTITTDI